MLSKITPVWSLFTKYKLIKYLSTQKFSKIEVIDVWERSHKTKITQHFDRSIGKGNFTIIFLKE
jgi:predicted protein tyrosine phosphatase